MFEIKSSQKFIRKVKILNLILGLCLIAFGTYLITYLYIYLIIRHGRYSYTIPYSIISIIFIISGVVKLLSYIYLKKANYLGIKLNILSLILLIGDLIFCMIGISGIYLIGTLIYKSGASSLMFIFSLFIFSSLLFLTSFLFLNIYKNKEELKNYLEINYVN